MDTTPLRIAIVSDAYFPQVSGVATTIEATKVELEKRGHTVLVISPRDFSFTIPMPGYPEIKLALFAKRKLFKMLDAFTPDAIHISVEGPLGLSARAYCKKHGYFFSTAYHTRFPEYVQVRFGIPLGLTYAFLRWFHGAADTVMVASETLIDELNARGITNTGYWTRGVDTNIFHANQPKLLDNSEGPIFMYMGRVAVEKNIGAFLALDLPGKKYIVGDGPARASLEARYPDALFVGYKFGDELASYLASADVFVFPSRTDTLGLVMLEANACGTPVASFFSQASESVITQGVNGVLSDDLADACRRALALSRGTVAEHAKKYGWAQPTDQFLNNLRVIAR